MSICLSFQTLGRIEMPHRSYVRTLAFAALLAMTGTGYAAEEPSVKLDRPGAGVQEIKKGDVAPDEYQRPSMAVQDWQKHHLSAPEKDEQWVKIHGKYALVSIPTGTVKEMVNGDGKK